MASSVIGSEVVAARVMTFLAEKVINGLTSPGADAMQGILWEQVFGICGITSKHGFDVGKIFMKLHPLNNDFAWVQPGPPYQQITQTQADAYRHQGGFVLENAFTQAEIARLVDALDPVEAEANAYLSRMPRDQPSIARADEIVFRPHAVLQTPVAKTFAKHPVFAALCRDLIGPGARLYWDQLVYKRPGTAQEFPWHQDNGYTFVTPQQYLTCWVALSDATPENGCPWIAPGLHTQGTLAHQWTDLGFECLDTGPADAEPMPLAAGSIAVFSSLTPHRTGPNLTDQVRKAYILQYAPDGALVHPHTGAAQPANAPDRQFLVDQ